MKIMTGPGGMPDPMRLRKLLKSNPALQKMMEAYAPTMGMGDGMGGMGGSGPGMMGGKGSTRNDAQRARLQERLRAKQNAGDVNIPEVKASKASGQAAAGGGGDGNDDDDWLTDIPKPAGGGGGKKAGGGKKSKKGKK